MAGAWMTSAAILRRVNERRETMIYEVSQARMRAPKPLARIDIVIAIANVAMDYHSGLNSRGYRLYCRCLRWLRREGYDHLPTRLAKDGRTRVGRMYAELSAKYGDRL